MFDSQRISSAAVPQIDDGDAGRVGGGRGNGGKKRLRTRFRVYDCGARFKSGYGYLGR